jgi:hypothetical protein
MVSETDSESGCGEVLPLKFVLSAWQCPLTSVGECSGSTGDHKVAKLAGLSFYELASDAVDVASPLLVGSCRGSAPCRFQEVVNSLRLI